MEDWKVGAKVVDPYVSDQVLEQEFNEEATKIEKDEAQKSLNFIQFK